MRKFSVMAMVFMALSLPVTMVSCGDDDPVEQPGGGGGGQGGDQGDGDDEGQGGQGTPGGVLSENEAKERLNNVADNLISQLNSADFNELSDVWYDVERETTDGSVFDSWIDAALDACEVHTAGDDILRLYQAANFYGQFELQDGKWVQTDTDVNNLALVFNDKQGNRCSLIVACSAGGTEIHHEEFDDEEWDWVSSYPYGGYYVTTRYENRFVVPEQINLRFTRGGQTPIEATVNTNLRLSDPSGEFNYKTDMAEVTVEVKAENYSVVVDKVMFNAGREAAASVTFSKGGRKLISASVEAAGDLSDDNNPMGSVSPIEIDIMGEVQLRGYINDIHLLSDCIEEADDNEGNETLFKDAVERANQYIDLGLYFNSSERSASVELYPFEDRGWYYTYWYYEPVMKFPSGASYSFEQYFDEDYFDNVVRRFKDMVESFVKLVDETEGENIDW